MLSSHIILQYDHSPEVYSQNVKLPLTSSGFARYKGTVEPPLMTSSLQLFLVLVTDVHAHSYSNLSRAVTTLQ